MKTSERAISHHHFFCFFSGEKKQKNMKPVKASLHAFGRLTRQRRASPKVLHALRQSRKALHVPKARFIYHISRFALTDEAPSLRSGMKHSPLRAEYEASRCASMVDVVFASPLRSGVKPRCAGYRAVKNAIRAVVSTEETEETEYYGAPRKVVIAHTGGKNFCSLRKHP